jgi:microcystin-dependent protein
MSEPFLGEIRLFSFANPNTPRGWAPCNGQILSIAQNQALFSILGTTYGGNGVTTFSLPNLQGSSAIGTGNNVALGQVGGEVAHTLTVQEIPPHTHIAQGTTGGSGSTPQSTPANGLWQTNADKKLYAVGVQPDVTMAPTALASAGGNQPHNNQQPYLALNFMIALQGIYPSRS